MRGGGGGGREYTRVLILLCITYMLTWMIQEIHHSSSTMQVKRETLHLSSDIWLADSRMKYRPVTIGFSTLLLQKMFDFLVLRNAISCILGAILT